LYDDLLTRVLKNFFSLIFFCLHQLYRQNYNFFIDKVKRKRQYFEEPEKGPFDLLVLKITFDRWRKMCYFAKTTNEYSVGVW